MRWKETKPMDERIEFVLLRESGNWSMSDLV